MSLRGGKHCHCTMSVLFYTFTRSSVTRVKAVDLREEELSPKDWIAACSVKVFAAPRNLGKHTAGEYLDVIGCNWL